MDARNGSRVSNFTFRGRLSFSPFKPAVVKLLSNGNAILDPVKNYVDSDVLGFIREYFNLPFCRFNRMPKPLLRKFGGNILSIQRFCHNKMYAKIAGDSPAESSDVTSTSGVTGFGDGFKINFIRSSRLIDVFLCFGRKFDNNYEVKFRCKLIFNPKTNKNMIVVKSAINADPQHSLNWAQEFYLFSRLNNAQFGSQCLLLTVVEKVDWLKLQFNYHPKECFRTPVGRVKKFINSECKKYRHHLEREAVVKEMKNALPFASNEDIVHKIVSGIIPLPDKLKGRKVGFFSTSSDSYSYTGGSHKNLGWPSELNAVRRRLNLSSEYSHCLIQRYEKGATIPFHRDNEPCYGKDVTVVTLNLNGKAVFKTRTAGIVKTQSLGHGDVCTMPAGFQLKNEHSVTSLDDDRISLTFRNSVINSQIKIGMRPPPRKQEVEYASVKLAYNKNGAEEFVVKYWSGAEVRIPNNRAAIKALFNATLNNKTYVLHSSAFTPFGSRLYQHKREYCWIDAFALANKKIPENCVPYPALTYAYLLRCGLGGVMKNRISFNSDGTGHFSRDAKVPNTRIGWDCRIGMKLTDDSPVTMKNIDVFFDDICTGIINQTVVRSENDVMSNIVRRVSDRINDLSRRTKDISISTSLSSSEKKKLSDLFPDLNIEFSDSSYSSHALFTAMRECENFIMGKRMNNSNFIDAGGDVVNYLHKSCKDVHVCCPIIDVKDAQRHMTRSNMLDKMIGFDENITMCKSLCQNCNVKKPNIVAVEVYDMTLEDMARSILSHNAKRFDFSLIIPPEISDGICEVSLFNNCLRVTSDGEKVKYMYGENGESYVHSVEPLRQILAVQVFAVNGVIFKKTLENSREALHFFSIVPCHDIPVGTYSFHSHFRKSEQDKVMMYIPVKDRFGNVNTVKVKTDKSVVCHLLEYVMNTALRVDDKALEYLISQFRARKSVSIKGGKVIQTPFDLPIDLYPGYLGVILGEGIRMRERTHYLAKMSYYKHYMPSMFTILITYLHRSLLKIRSYLYVKTVDVLKYVMSEEFLNEIVYGDRRIFEIEETYYFSQEVNIVGKVGEMDVLTNSFSKFIRESKENVNALDMALLPIDDRFPATELDVLRDLVTSGGGGKIGMNFSQIPEACDFDMESCLVEYNFFTRIYKTIGLFFRDARTIHKLAGILSKVLRYFIHSGKYVLKTLKSLFFDVFDMCKGGGKSISNSLQMLIRRIVSLITNRRTTINNQWIEDLLTMVEEDERILQREMKVFNMKNNSRIDQDEIDQLPVSDFVNDEALMDQLSAQVKEIVISGGGEMRVIGILKYPYRICKKNLLKLKEKIKRIKTVLISYFEYLWDVLAVFPDFVKSCVDEIKSKIMEYISSEDGLEFIIQGVAFSAANVIFHCFIGNLSPAAILFSTTLFFALKTFGIEKKYLGYNFITSQFANVLSLWSPLGIMTFPVKTLLAKSVETKLKKVFVEKNVLKETSLQLVAKDVLSAKVYDYVDASFIRKCICILLLLILHFPKLVISSILCLILIKDQKKYFNSLVYQANVAISYASVVKKSVKSKRNLDFKKLLMERFKTKKETKEEESLLGDEQIGNESPEKEVENDDVEVEFDYDGSYVEVAKKNTKWADVPEKSMTSSDYAALNISLLKPATQKVPFNSRVRFSVSDVLLRYPISESDSYVESGDEAFDAIKEFYYLESKKLCIELGKLDNAVRRFNARNEEMKPFRDVVWDLRNQLDDSTLYISSNGQKWNRLRRGDVGHEKLEGKCKININQDLLDFDSVESGIMFTSDELMGMYTNQRCLGLETLFTYVKNPKDLVLPADVHFFNKPPGAGKTTSIVENLFEDHNKRRRAMAVTCTSAGKKEIIQKLMNKGVKNAHSMVNTYDSILMRANKNAVDIVYCDEVYMVHAGEWLACMQLLRPGSVKCYGDVNQIPFINRVPGTSSIHSMKLYSDYPVTHDNVSYRCPPDVCYILSNLTDATGNKLYPNGVYSAGKNSDSLRTISVVGIYSGEDSSYVEGEKHITFTQPEKEEISRVAGKALGKSVPANTVNEVQGGTFPTVNLYRLRQYDNPLYQNINQFVVAISRHTERMSYKVVNSKLNDFVADKLGSLNTVADYIIKEYKFKQRV
nr:methyltransferase-helicase [Crinivirus sp.]